MLLPDNIHPENSLYYNGAFIIEILQDQDSINLLDLYQKVKKQNDISFPVFILCLDWLYISDIAIIDGGLIKLCT